MALQYVVDNVDQLDEGVRGLYVSDGDKYRLDVAGVEDTSGLKSALEKERKAARDAAARLKDLERKYDGIDPEKVKSIYSKLDNDEEAKLLAEGRFDDVVARRTDRLRQNYEDQLSKTTKERDAFRSAVLDREILQAAIKAEVHDSATQDVLLRAKGAFDMDESGKVFVTKDGDKVFGRDGKTPLGVDEWMAELKASAKHLFKANTSGGGSSRAGSQGNAGKQISREQFNSMTDSDLMAFFKAGGRVTD